LTGAAAADSVHPIGELDAAGVVCTLDVDDPALFSTTISDEYALVAGWLGDDAVVRFARNAIEVSFASAQRKAELRSALVAASAESPRQAPETSVARRSP
jgi:aminodeoxyfutalosine deaminase